MKKSLLTTVISVILCTFLLSFNALSTEKSKENKLSPSNLISADPPAKIEIFDYNILIFGGTVPPGTNPDSVPSLKTTFEYSANSTTSITYNWKSSWLPSVKMISFQKNSQTDSTVIYSWKSATSTWKKESKVFYEYSGKNNIRFTSFIADSATGTWNVNIKNDISYNAAGDILKEEMYMFEKQGKTWLPISKEQYFYNSQGKRDSSISYYAIPGSDFMLNSSKTVFYYSTSGTPSYEIDYEWQMAFNKWEKSGKQSYQFNSKGNVYLWLGYEWEDFAQDWVLTDKDSVIYKNGETPLVGYSFETPYGQNKLYLSQKMFYSYSVGTLVDPPLKENKFLVYPNPANDRISVKLVNPQNARVEIFDLSGRKVFQTAVYSELSTIRIDKLQRGNYILKVYNQNKIQTQLFNKY